jgi:AbrB family looped-hinge helix DNA binding protein
VVKLVEKLSNESAVTVSNHGRVTIPAMLRKKFSIKDGDRVTFIEDEGTLRIIPLLDLESIRSSSYTVAEMERVQAESRKDELERDG